MAQKPKIKKKIKLGITSGNIYIQASFNNTHITLTDNSGNILFWSSAGKLGFSGTRKSTPHAATQVMQSVIEKIKEIGIPEIGVLVNGVGTGRESSLRSLASSSVNIKSISDITPIAHNGPRQAKARRV